MSANLTKLKEIEKQFEQKYPEQLIYDGIVNTTLFEQTSPKILWVLKEANDKDQTSWSLCEFMDKGVDSYANWRRTYALIIKISYAIINNIKTYDAVPPEHQIKDILKKVAFINLKKMAGASQAHHGTVRRYYLQDKDLIRQQIEAINPDIIINCSRVWNFFTDMKTTDVKNVECFQVSHCSKACLINAYHPNQYSIKQAKYFELIQSCLK